MNEFTRYTRQQDGKSTAQNSDVILTTLLGDQNILMSYYSWIEEIYELDYIKFRIPYFFVNGSRIDVESEETKMSLYMLISTD